MNHATPTSTALTPSPNPQTDVVRTLNSVELFAGHKKLTIQHNEFVYILRITRENKLILTK
jgi:hemin uptake protein HemP